MGELIDLQAYREQKEAAELEQLREELRMLLPPVFPEPYFPPDLYDPQTFIYFYSHPIDNYSIDDYGLGSYYRADAMFSDEALLDFWKELITDEAVTIRERTTGEIEPDGTQ